MKILKFGGSSIQNFESICQVKNIIINQLKTDKLCVIFSAFGGLTDLLLKISHLAVSNHDYHYEFNKIYNFVVELGNELNICLNYVLCLMTDLLCEFQMISCTSNLSLRHQDIILSFGEIITNIMLFEYFNKELCVKSIYINSQSLIKTNNNYGNAAQLTITYKIINDYFTGLNYDLFILPGFIGSTLKNQITTLGRGGGDLTASIFGKALHANSIEIYSDVDGIMTANPKFISNTQLLTSLTYNHAYEIAFYGGKVLYHKTLNPARQANIPLRIRNTFNYSNTGTLITNSNKQLLSNNSVLAITSQENLTLFKIKAILFKDSNDLFDKLINVLTQIKINIYFISYSISESQIYFCVHQTYQNLVSHSIHHSFSKNEIFIDIFNNKSVISIITQNQLDVQSTLASFFNYFHNSIKYDNITNNDLSINLVVNSQQTNNYITQLHQYFILNQQLTHIFFIGFGKIAKTLFHYINDDPTLKISGIINSKSAYFNNNNNINIDDINNYPYTDFNIIINQIINYPAANKTIIDLTASEQIPKIYSILLKHNIKIVTANKIGFSDDFSLFSTLQQYFFHKLFFTTTCGSWLPIIQTIYDLTKTNAKINKITGVFSGTLNFIFHQLINSNDNFSEIVKSAYDLGYTEPNPYSDLSGSDVARKILILARLLGSKSNLSDIQINNLADSIPHDSISDFFNNLPNLNSKFDQLRNTAIDNKQHICYVASYDLISITTDIMFVDSTHPFYNLHQTCNMVIINLDNSTNPIIISGSGAGITETAIGVYRDVKK